MDGRDGRGQARGLLTKNSRDRAHRRSEGWRVCAGVCLAATLGPVAAQNLAQNPRFDGSVAPWATVFSAAPDPVGAGTVAYNGTQDVDGNAPGSGSVQLDVPSVAAAGTARAEIAARECLPVPAGQQPVTEARYSARLRVPVAGNAADSLLNASIEVQFYSDAACATAVEGGSVGEGRVLGSGVPDDAFWYTLADPQFIPAAPLGAQSVEVRLAVTRLADTGSAASVQFDNVLVALNGTTPVQLQHFEVE